MPCQEIFDNQTVSYKKKILNETKYKFSIEAGSTSIWKKYIGQNGISFGIEQFGKSAPYKKLYEYFHLTDSKISQKIIKFIKNEN